MYPPIAPPTVNVTCQYPGASAQVVAETIAAPIEQQVNGVENMMYMSSQCTNDGSYTLTVTFRNTVDLNLAQVLVQNRVALAMPNLPDVIKATGVMTKKQAPDILLAIGIYSPDGRYDQLYLSNYATIQLQPVIARLPGISDVRMFGQRDYSMRIWLDPDKLAARSMTAGDVVMALREQNLQVAAGQVGQSPTVPGQQTQITLTTLGRLAEIKEFENVIIKTTPEGRIVRVARRGLGRARSQEPGRQQQGRRPPDLEPRHLSVARRQRPGHCRHRQGQDRRAQERVSAGRRLHDPLRHDAVHPRVDQRGVQDPAGLGDAGRARRAGFPPELAVGDHPLDRGARRHRRHVRRDAGDGLFAQQPDSLRPGAGDRHRGGRRDRGRRVGRAPHRARPEAPRRHDQGDERGFGAGDRGRPGAFARCSSPARSSRESPASSSGSSR